MIDPCRDPRSRGGGGTTSSSTPPCDPAGALPSSTSECDRRRPATSMRIRLRRTPSNLIFPCFVAHSNGQPEIQHGLMVSWFWEYLFVYVVQYYALTWTEYARFFYYCDFWRTLSFRPNTTTLYLMISCEGELRNGTKYAELAYLLLISGNSGVQKRMA